MQFLTHSQRTNNPWGGFSQGGKQKQRTEDTGQLKCPQCAFQVKRMIIPYKYGGYCAEKGRFVSSCQNKPHKNFVRVYKLVHGTLLLLSSLKSTRQALSNSD